VAEHIAAIHKAWVLSPALQNKTSGMYYRAVVQKIQFKKIIVIYGA
jgi:hypothetical protein